MVRDLVYKYMADWVGEYLENTDEELVEGITEIRFRNSRPVIFVSGNEEYGIMEKGFIKDISLGRKAVTKDIQKAVELVSNFSLYAWEDELKNGFITIPGGHRVGICGKAVVENGQIKTLSLISSINFRIKHQIIGCSEKILKYIPADNMGNMLIISPPGGGKTTLIRDLARMLSDGRKGHFKGMNVGIVDERSEIAGCFMGVPQNDVGLRTDVIDRAPKACGMLMLLRSMAPKVIIADEIGNKEDIEAIEYIINSGVKLICTVHGSSIDEIRKKPYLSNLIKRKLFSRYILLDGASNPGSVKEAADENLNRLNP